MAVKLIDYLDIVGREAIDEIRLLADRLQGKRLKMVNSTAVGGGVAEILNRLVPLFNEQGVETHWDVIKGDNKFFDVTKAFHNALHGNPVEITSEMYDIFLENNAENLEQMSFDEEFVVIHDPQPAALISAKENSSAKWVWRCHIDLSNPHEELWQFLKKYVSLYDGSIFSAPSFSKELPIPQYMIYPSIDPLADKNRDLTDEEVSGVLEKYKLDPERPIITQISRFDWLKDPVGVIEAYRLVKKRNDCQLVLAGGGATDDPEAGQVLDAVKESAGNDPDIHVLTLPPFSDFEINALQRGSSVVLQKSLKEGFGLTVTEALWKGKPVIAGAVGGIPIQVRHNLTGVLVHSVEGAAYQIRTILNNPEMAEKLGKLGKERVRENFLLTRSLRDYLLLLLIVERPGESVIHL